ncbi:MAG: ribonuclease H-like domain-containing protein [Spirochaetia bacterium]|jgi:uncharacterized protein YprB with RNaseH-like and TPR domain|nr:ribonuclease H-like domain-containing protein [Spirochaetia bacterium]
MKERLARIRLGSGALGSVSRSLPLKRTVPVDFPSGWNMIEHGLRFKETIAMEPAKAHGESMRLGRFTTRAPETGINLKDIVFFDLETTGLSGGTGTLAFLAALGAFMPDGRFAVRQYFIDDYPAETAFLERLDAEFSKASAVISYNGASFDMPLYSVRRIMNGLGAPPMIVHVDVIHAARRLWRHTLGNCSLGNLESTVLGLRRSGDISGSEVPAVWFDFLKHGCSDRLHAVFSHNEQDVRSLAALFLLIYAGIAGGETIPCQDPVGLAALQARLDHGMAEKTLLTALAAGNVRAVRPLMRLYRVQGQLLQRMALIPLLPDDPAGLFSKSVYAERILGDLTASKSLVDAAILSAAGVLKERAQKRSARLDRKLRGL